MNQIALLVNVLIQNNNAPRDNPSRGFFLRFWDVIRPNSGVDIFCLRGIILSEIKKGTNQNGKIRQKKKVLYDS